MWIVITHVEPPGLPILDHISDSIVNVLILHPSMELEPGSADCSRSNIAGLWFQTKEIVEESEVWRNTKEGFIEVNKDR